MVPHSSDKGAETTMPPGTSNGRQVLKILRSARSWLGTPYLHQASAKGHGCDCLGLVRGVWRETVGEEPEQYAAYSRSWAEVGSQEELLRIAKTYFHELAGPERAPGDLLIFRMRRAALAKHAGILSGEKTFIHAFDGASVVESTLSDFWVRRIAGVFRFPPVTSQGQL